MAPRRFSRCILGTAFATALVVAAFAVAGCGGDGTPDRPEQAATLVLDARPNAVHAGILLTVARDFDGADGVELRIRAPSPRRPPLGELVARRAQLAVLDIHDLARARERGRDVVGVMALVQRPLAAVLARPPVRRPRDLAGRRVAVTGTARDAAVLRAIVRGNGGDPARVRPVRAGSSPVAALRAGRVSAATGFWPAAEAAAGDGRPPLRAFRVEDSGAPSYPELVLCVTRETLDEHPGLVRATVTALRRGYGEALIDPESAVGALVDRYPSLDRTAEQRAFDAVSPAFTAGAPRFGALDPPTLRAWASWEAQAGITRRPPDVERAFAPGF
jgi:ABC-type nitrate/sulfonate/bicarbonate transport system substrate-binding protein